MKQRLEHATLLTALAVLASCACSSPAEPSEGKAGSATGGGSTMAGAGGDLAAGGKPGSSGSSSGGAGGAGGGDAGAGAGTGGAPSSRHTGQVALYNLLADRLLTLDASFVASRVAGQACDLSSAGACSAALCPDALGGSQQLVSAGMVSVTSPEVQGSLSMTPAGDGSYSMPTNSFAQLFAGQEHVNFQATGGVVPAFASELDVPLVLLLSAPLFVAGAANISAPRAQDLSLSWTRGAEAELLYIQGSSARPDGQPGSASLTCQFPSQTGSGTISATLLQKLAVGAELSLFTTNSKLVQAGDYAVSLAVVTGVANPDKAVIPRILLQ